MEKRILRGVPWIFMNEIANLKELRCEEKKDTRICNVVNDSGRELGVAFFNKKQKLLPVAGHMVANNSFVTLGEGFFRNRVARALKLREALVEGRKVVAGTYSASSTMERGSAPEVVRGDAAEDKGGSLGRGESDLGRGGSSSSSDVKGGISTMGTRMRTSVGPYYRLINSEGDRLPGFVVDRFADVMVCQFLIPGAEALERVFLKALYACCSTTANPIRFFVVRKDDPMRRWQKLSVTEKPAILEARTLQHLSTTVVDAAQTSPKTAQADFEELVDTILRRTVVEESGVYEKCDILNWDYGLRDVRSFLARKRMEEEEARVRAAAAGDVDQEFAAFHCSGMLESPRGVDVFGYSRFYADQEGPNDGSCADEDDGEEGGEENDIFAPFPRPSDEEHQQHVAGGADQKKLNTSARLQYLISKDAERFSLASRARPVRFLTTRGGAPPGPGLILDLPRVSATAIPRARKILQEKLRVLFKRTPVRNYRWLVLIVRDRLLQSVIKRLVDAPGLMVEADFSNPVDFPVHLSVPKSTHLRSFVFRNEWFGKRVPDAKSLVSVRSFEEDEAEGASAKAFEDRLVDAFGYESRSLSDSDISGASEEGDSPDREYVIAGLDRAMDEMDDCVVEGDALGSRSRVR